MGERRVYVIAPGEKIAASVLAEAEIENCPEISIGIPINIARDIEPGSREFPFVYVETIPSSKPAPSLAERITDALSKIAEVESKVAIIEGKVETLEAPK